MEFFDITSIHFVLFWSFSNNMACNKKLNQWLCGNVICSFTIHIPGCSIYYYYLYKTHCLRWYDLEILLLTKLNIVQSRQVHICSSEIKLAVCHDSMWFLTSGWFLIWIWTTNISETDKKNGQEPQAKDSRVWRFVRENFSIIHFFSF